MEPETQIAIGQTILAAVYFSALIGGLATGALLGILFTKGE